MGDRSEQSSLVDYARILWFWRWVVIAVTLGCLVLSLLYSLTATKVYEAKADLLLAPPVSTALLQSENPVASGSMVDVPTGIEIIGSATVASMVAKSVGSAPTETAKQVGTSSVVEITVESTKPSLAAKAADAYANAYVTLQHQQTTSALDQAQNSLREHLASVQAAVNSVSNEIARTSSNQPGVQAELAAVQSALQVEEATLQNQIATDQAMVSDGALGGGELITPASIPTKPSKPKTAEYSVFAVIIGLIVGIGLALILQVFRESSSGPIAVQGSGPSESRGASADGGVRTATSWAAGPPGSRSITSDGVPMPASGSEPSRR
jgi:uncharacterized protein involved in exopolysaccharide biosynthesis